jgi:hypothetical protein
MARPEVEFLSSERVRQAIDADLAEAGVQPLGGDCIYVPGYTARGPVGVAWGREHEMTWTCRDEYYEESDAVFDEGIPDAFVARIPADC